MWKWICLLVLGLSLGPLCHGCHGDDDIRLPKAPLRAVVHQDLQGDGDAG